MCGIEKDFSSSLGVEFSERWRWKPLQMIKTGSEGPSWIRKQEMHSGQGKQNNQNEMQRETGAVLPFLHVLTPSTSMTSLKALLILSSDEKQVHKR
jgi:hypothetical protein